MDKKSEIRPAEIISFEELEVLRPKLGIIVCTSGPFDPLHPGHASCLFESKKYGDTLVVVVNGDEFLRVKKGKPFIDLQTRCEIVTHIIGVDYVIPFEIKNDQTVCVALEKVKPHVFTKGGDRRNAETIPEWDTCVRNGIEIVTGVGRDKVWSSSDFLKEWLEFHNKLK